MSTRTSQYAQHHKNADSVTKRAARVNCNVAILIYDTPVVILRNFLSDNTAALNIIEHGKKSVNSLPTSEIRLINESSEGKERMEPRSLATSAPEISQAFPSLREGFFDARL